MSYFIAMNSSIPFGQNPGEWDLEGGHPNLFTVFNANNPPTSTDKCPGGNNYCWKGYSQNDHGDWMITRFPAENTVGYDNVAFVYNMAAEFPLNESSACILRVSTNDGTSFATVDEIQSSTVGNGISETKQRWRQVLSQIIIHSYIQPVNKRRW